MIMTEHREEATLAGATGGEALPLPELLRRTVEIASALHQYHRQGHVHGHLQPSSIMLTEDGLEFADPGPDAVRVTPYTAPEQMRGLTDPRSDIFAFGAIVYEMATGWKAFAGDTEEELEAAILEKQPPAIGILRQDAAAALTFSALDRLVASCLVKNPDHRRQRMQNVLVELKLMVGSVGRSSPATSTGPPAKAELPRMAPPPMQTAKPVEPKADLGPNKPAVNEPQPELETTGAARVLPAIHVPARRAVGPVLPHAGLTKLEPPPSARSAVLPVPETGPSPAETAGVEPAAEKPVAGPQAEDPAAAERRASEILSRVGFGELPVYLVDQGQKRQKWKFSIHVGTSETQARIWRVFKYIALVMLAAAAVWAGIQLGRGLLLNARWRSRTAAPLGVLRFALPAPEQASYLSSPAISPDGTLLAFSAVDPGHKRLLWIRPLNSLNATPLANTENALAPFWSPDGKNIGFFAGKKLKKIAVSGGPPTDLCDTDGLAGGGAWSSDGVIVFGRSFYDALYKVPATGGAAERASKLDSARGERAHLWPRFLPDGRHFVFFTLSDQDENNGISVASLENKEARHLLMADTNAIYAELNTPSSTLKNGYLLFASGHHLNARSFDPITLTFKGQEFTVADEINYLEFINLLPISASENGLLAYQSIDTPKRQLVWMDREGNQVGALGEPAEYGQARISPDGRHVAVNRLSPANKNTADLWVFDVETNRASQFTSAPTHEGSPVWSPDGKQIVYFANPQGHFDLFRKSLAHPGEQELLLASSEDKYPNDWSPDGRYLLFGSVGTSTNSDLRVLSMKGERSPQVYLQTVAAEGWAQFSPDGKWVAYESDESGRAQVYVEPFPRVDGNSPRWQISTGGGGQPKWRGDGKELFYMMRNGKMMAATVTAGAKFTASEPHLLFPTRALPHDVNMYDVTRDGRRFLVNTPLEWSTSSPITVVANWTEGFRKK
jgi:Tol biopolymer transport system component